MGSRDGQYATSQTVVSLACEEKKERRKELTGTVLEVPEPLVLSKQLGSGDLVSWLFPWLWQGLTWTQAMQVQVSTSLWAARLVFQARTLFTREYFRRMSSRNG